MENKNFLVTGLNGAQTAGLSVQATTGAASTAIALPTTADGTRAKFVRIASKSTAYIIPGFTSPVTVITPATAMLINASEAIHLNVTGFTHIIHIQETAATIVNITPIEVG